jgi:hypothetical protein
METSEQGSEAWASPPAENRPPTGGLDFEPHSAAAGFAAVPSLRCRNRRVDLFHGGIQPVGLRHDATVGDSDDGRYRIPPGFAVGPQTVGPVAERLSPGQVGEEGAEHRGKSRKQKAESRNGKGRRKSRKQDYGTTRPRKHGTLPEPSVLSLQHSAGRAGCGPPPQAAQ